MGAWGLDRVRLADGVWHGVLTGPRGEEPPALSATCGGTELAPPRVAPLGEGRWSVAIDLPASVIADGVRALAIGPEGGEALRIETFDFGDPLAADLRADLAALRAEVDVLKRAFRRHVAETD